MHTRNSFHSSKMSLANLTLIGLNIYIHSLSLSEWVSLARFFICCYTAKMINRGLKISKSKKDWLNKTTLIWYFSCLMIYVAVFHWKRL